MDIKNLGLRHLCFLALSKTPITFSQLRWHKPVLSSQKSSLMWNYSCLYSNMWSSRLVSLKQESLISIFFTLFSQ